MTCIFVASAALLNVSIFLLRGRRSTLDESCCGFLVNPIVRVVSEVVTSQLHGRCGTSCEFHFA